MSSDSRAARRRAARSHGGSPPDFWHDYRWPLQVTLGILLVTVLVGGALIARARQTARAEIDDYCQVYDQTHDDIAAAKASVSTTTAAPGTTVALAAGTTGGTTVGASTGTTLVPDGTVPPSAGTSTTVPPVDATARIKAAAEKRQAVGPKSVRDAWTRLTKALSSAKPTASQQNDIQSARTTVNDFAKNECGRDPPDL